MDTELKKKKESGKRKVLLSREAFDRVTRWVSQIKEQRKGAKVNPSDMVEFILQSHSDDLSGNEVREFQDRYVSEIDLARWAVKELMAASARGQKLTLAELLAAKPKAPSEKRLPRRQQTDVVPDNDSLKDDVCMENGGSDDK